MPLPVLLPGSVDEDLALAVGRDLADGLLPGEVDGVDVALGVAGRPLDARGELALPGQRLGHEQVLVGLGRSFEGKADKEQPPRQTHHCDPPHTRLLSSSPESCSRRRALPAWPGRLTHGLQMDVHDILDLGSIAACHGDGNRQSGRLAEVEDHAIVARPVPLADGQSAEAVASERIGAGQVNRQVGPGPLQGLPESLLQGRQIDGIVGAILQGHVQVAPLLAQGKIASPRIEKVKMVGSSARITAVPLPW